MPLAPISGAAAKREEIQRKAAAMGIDDAYVDLLVDTFYERIRAHSDLAPVFASVIEDWPPHLARMKDFWASAAYNAGRYSGRPIPAHMKIKGLTPQLFQQWLGLFRQTLEETAPSPEVVEHFMSRANRIAASLQLAVFGLPNLPRREIPADA